MARSIEVQVGCSPPSHPETYTQVTEHWVDLTAGGETARYPLKNGLTRIGGPGADVVVPGALDELHVWSDPPKVIHVGTASVPLLAGRAFDEQSLADGDTIQWGAAVLVYGRAGQAVIEELLPEPAPAPASAAPASAAPPSSGSVTSSTRGEPARLRSTSRPFDP